MLRLAAAIALVLAVPASAEAAPAFPFGVAAGEVRATVLSSGRRSPAPGPSGPRCRRTGASAGCRRRARRADDPRRRARRPRRVAALSPGRRYWYRFRQGRAVSPVGSFRTAPRPGARCASASPTPATPTARETRGRAARLQRLRGLRLAWPLEGNDFNVNLGDTIYSDSEVGCAAGPAGAHRHRARRRSTSRTSPCRCAPPRRPASTATGTTTSSSTTSPLPEHGAARSTRPADGVHGLRAGRADSRDGLYRSIRWGRNLELFFLDERSFRDARRRDGGMCDNPQTGPARPRADRAAARCATPSARSCRGCAQPVDAGLPRPDRRPRPDDARRAPVRALHARDRRARRRRGRSS